MVTVRINTFLLLIIYISIININKKQFKISDIRAWIAANIPCVLIVPVEAALLLCSRCFLSSQCVLLLQSSVSCPPTRTSL